MVKFFRENKLSIIGKTGVTLLLVAMGYSVLINIYNAEVYNPKAFLIIFIGFLLFLIAKISVVSKGRLVSFGSGFMSNSFANLYRFGYWLMVVGILFTFLGDEIVV